MNTHELQTQIQNENMLLRKYKQNLLPTHKTSLRRVEEKENGWITE